MAEDSGGGLRHAIRVRAEVGAVAYGEESARKKNKERPPQIGQRKERDPLFKTLTERAPRLIGRAIEVSGQSPVRSRSRPDVSVKC
jgi:hypothetical protein